MDKEINRILSEILKRDVLRKNCNITRGEMKEIIMLVRKLSKKAKVSPSHKTGSEDRGKK